MATAQAIPARSNQGGLTQRLLDGVERMGNKVPHPVLMFLYLILLVIVLSHVLYLMGVSVTEQIAEPVPISVTPDYFEDTSEPTLAIPAEDPEFVISERTVAIQSLLTVEGIRFIFTRFVANFQGFGAMAVTFIALLGAGIAEHAGLMAALIRKARAGGAAAVVHLHPRVRRRAGQHRRRRRISDPHSSGRRRLSQPGAASTGRPGCRVRRGRRDFHGEHSHHAYRQHVERGHQRSDRARRRHAALAHRESVLRGSLVGGHGPGRHVRNRANCRAAARALPRGRASAEGQGAISPEESRGLTWALYGFLAVLAVMLLITVPPGAPLRPPPGSDSSPLLDSLLFCIFLFFLVAGICFGFGAGTFKTKNDVIKAGTTTLASLGGLVFMFLMISQFIAFFNYSNMPRVAAIAMADGFEQANIGALPLLVGMIVVILLLDLIIPGALPKWAIFAPVFVPLFVRLGVAPQTVFAAYRIGDSPVNIITPLMVYLPFVVTVAQKYEKERRHRDDRRADAAVHADPLDHVDHVLRALVLVGHSARSGVSGCGVVSDWSLLSGSPTPEGSGHLS